MLNQFMRVGPGHWGGWMIGAFPMIGPIHLEGAEGAIVSYRIGYRGGDLKMKRVAGAWRLIDVVKQWIE